MKSGEAAKPKTTARQRWMASNFTYLDSHRTIRTKTSKLERLMVPAATTSGVDEDDDALSATMSQAPGQVATSSQATQPPRDSQAFQPPGPPGQAQVLEEWTTPSCLYWIG